MASGQWPVVTTMEGRDAEEFYSELQMWNKTALKQYLQARCLPVSGGKDLLISRVFSAIENSVPTERDGEDSLRHAERQYQDILERCGINDPLDISTGWVDETEGGTSQWPSVTSYELIDWHTTKSASMAPYKIDKAYQYFKGDLTKNVSFHPLSTSSPNCVLLNTCVRSMERSKEPHEAWVCVDKLTAKIKGAYCSCVVGLSEICNHVSALLFKIEHVVKEGGNVGTSNLCAWKAPSGKVTMLRIDKPVEELLEGWNRSTYSRPKRKRPMLSKRRQSFLPNTPHQSSEQRVADVRNEFLTMTSKAQPDASLLGALTRQERETLGLPVSDVAPAAQPSTSSTPIPTIASLWENFLSSEGSEQQAVDFAHFYLPEYFDSHPGILETVTERTKGQSTSPIWAEQRQHRLTASSFLRIVRRQEHIETGKGRVRTDNTQFCNNLFRAAQFRLTMRHVPAPMAWGITNEKKALETYRQLHSPIHQNFKIEETGFCIDSSVPFIGATPDALVSCDCHGTKCLEIKCPFSIRDADPNVDRPDYLTPTNELKRDHSTGYYHQIQGQMGILRLKTCDFFVWTPHGNVTVSVPFNEHHWIDTREKLENFYVSTYVPLILMKQSSNEGTSKPKQLTTWIGPRKFRPKPKRGRPQTKAVAPSYTTAVESSSSPSPYLCPVCKDECPDEPGSFELCSIGCDECQSWLHYPCAGFVDEDDVPTGRGEKWHCNFCICKT